MNKATSSLITLTLLLSLVLASGIGSANLPAVIAGPGDLLFSSSGNLASGEARPITYPVSSQKDVNVKMQVSSASGDNDVRLQIADGSGTEVFNDQIRDGETLWIAITLKPTNNVFTLTNLSGVTLQYELRIYETDAAPYTWNGTSLGATAGNWRSYIRLNFPTSGLYQFDLGLTSGRYQFLLDGEYIQKTVIVTGTVVSYYVAAGVHDLRIEPDGGETETPWSLDISGPGATTDSLPYTKNGGDLRATATGFNKEWLPVNLPAARKVNFELSLAGASTDKLDIYLYGSSGAIPIYTVANVYGGETVWWQTSLPSGVSRIKIETDSGNASFLTYDLSIDGIDSAPYNWAGKSSGAPAAWDSHIVLNFPSSALYTFDFGATSGRYQFSVGSQYISKTVETGGTVEYFVPAGNHLLRIVPDRSSGDAVWTLNISAPGPGADALPYTKTGGDLGSAVNPFAAEWLPLNASAATAGAANFRLTLSGGWNDGLKAYVYQGSTLVYTTPAVYGGETFWWTTDLAAGVNQIVLQAEDGNNASLQYNLAINTPPSPSCTWSGISKDSGGNSVAQVNIPTAGTYHVTFNTPLGLGQVIVDGGLATAGGMSKQSPGHLADFDIQLSAGLHSFAVKQTTTEATTAWTLTIDPTTPGQVIAHFGGDLGGLNKYANPQLPLSGTQNKEVNLKLTVSGGSLDLVVTDGTGGAAFNGSVVDGETVWGTTTLKPGQNTFTVTQKTAGSLTYDLTVYQIDSAPYTWAGKSKGTPAAWDSHIVLNFPSSALYTFGFGATSGRYQFWVGNQYISKTVETGGTVAYFVPAGNHVLKIVPDRDKVETDWTLIISSPGAGTDALPYTKTGGNLGGTGKPFAAEWLPLNAPASVAANFSLTLTGALADGLAVHLYQGSSLVYSTPVIYGEETFWWTTDLAAGVNRILLQAEGGNSASLQYDLAIRPIPEVNSVTPYTWSGVSRGPGGNSKVELQIPLAGVYHVLVDVTTGYADLHIDEIVGITSARAPQSITEFDVDLNRGSYLFTVDQSTFYAKTEWTVTVSTDELFENYLPTVFKDYP